MGSGVSWHRRWAVIVGPRDSADVSKRTWEDSSHNGIKDNAPSIERQVLLHPTSLGGAWPRGEGLLGGN